MHGPEEMPLKLENTGLLKKSVTHEEFLGGSRNVSVTMLDPHTGESCLLYLNSN